jgi:hypothetical protein
MLSKLKYRLFSLLVLLSISCIAAADCFAAPAKKTSQEISFPSGNESDVNFIDHIPGLSLCNINEVQPPVIPGSKKGQGERDLLLLQSNKTDDIVKAWSGDHIKFADELTHISLSLFPHHFFW